MKRKIIASSIISAGFIFCVYTTGKIIGHMDCLKNITNRYGTTVPNDKIASDVNDYITITLHKKEKA